MITVTNFGNDSYAHDNNNSTVNIDNENSCY